MSGQKETPVGNRPIAFLTFRWHFRSVPEDAMKPTPASVCGPVPLLLALLLPLVSAFAADEAAIQAEIEAVRKAGLAQWKDRLPDNFETYVRDTGTRNYYQREFNVALTNGNATALAVVFKEFPEFGRPQFLNGYVVQTKSALHYAVERGHREVVELLLAQKVGADAPRPTTPSASFGFTPDRLAGMRPMPPHLERRDTPLHLAVRAGNADLVQTLLDAGASLEAMDTRGETPLMQTVKQLTGTGYNPSSAALGSDARERLERMLTLLLARGAVVMPTNRTYTSEHPLALATRFRNDALFDRLLTNSTHRAATNEAGNSLVHFAVNHGRTNALRSLAAQGAPLAVVNSAGVTPLQLLAWMPAVRQLPVASPGSSSQPYTAQTYAAFVRQQSADLLLAGGVVADAPALAGLDRTNALAALLRRDPALGAATDANGRGALHYAVQGGSLDAVKILLAHRAPKEARDRAGQTPLMLALANRRLADVAALVAAGASVIATNNSGQTALHVAVGTGGDTNLLAALLAAGADVNARDTTGQTPVELAALSQRFDLVHWLQGRGAAVAAPSQRLMTMPLHQAVAQGNLAAVSNLLALRADVNARNEQGHTPLALAVNAGRVDLVMTLLTNGANVNLPDTNGVTPLRARFFAANDPVPDPVPKPGFSKRPSAPKAARQTATRADSLPPDLRPAALPGQPPLNNLLLLLLENGADPKLPDTRGNTILHALPLPPPDYNHPPRPKTALIPEATARIRLLASYGLAPDTRATNGLTPLHAIVAQANLVQTFALLEAGAGINTPDRQGRTALHHVLTPQMNPHRWQHEPETRKSLTNTLALLLDNGADLRRADTNGATPLHLLPAMDEALRELVLPVLKTNAHFLATLRLKNKAGTTPVLAAFEQLRVKPVSPVARMLGAFLDAGAELPAATEGGDTTLLHELAGISVVGHPFFGPSQPDPEGTALIARLATNTINRAASLDMRNAKQETPLHVATRAQNITFAALLLARGANPNVQDVAGDTPLHLAVRGVAPPYYQHPVIPLLMSNRCDLARRNAAGESSLRLELMRRYYPGPLFLPPGATNSFFQAARTGDFQSLDAYLTLDQTLATLADPVTQVSALRAAALAGQVAVAERLRNAGATDPVSAALLGWTNSLAAFVHTTPGLGATQPQFGIPLLHSAAGRGQLAAVQLLLTPEVSPGLADGWGRTALFHAATNGSTNVIAWLTGRGARHTLFDAIALGDQRRVDALLTETRGLANTTNTQTMTPLLYALDRGEKEIVRRLLAAGADPNHASASLAGNFPATTLTPGTVPLHLAVWSNRVDLAELLGNAGARVNAATTQGYTALHFAVARGHREVTEWLLAQSADPNATASSSNAPGRSPAIPIYQMSLGWTPLHLAVRYGHPRLIELLVAKGAKLEATDAQGRTPADLLQRGFGFENSPWPPSPYRGLAPGMPTMEMLRDPTRAADVTETLRKLGAVIPSTRGASFRGPPPGFPVPPPGFLPAPKH